jgi:hypothetical protein
LTILLASAALAQTAEQEKSADRAGALAKPLFECVVRSARSSELYSSPERTDIVAIAAVGHCSKEEGQYNSALSDLKKKMSGFDADSMAQRTHQKLIEKAVTIIVDERQRKRNSN